MAQAANTTPEHLVTLVENAPAKIAMATGLELRSAYNRGRLTPGVLDYVANKLENDHRIGLAPEDDEPSQEQEFYLYKLDAPVGALVTAIRQPSEAGLRRLRDVATATRVSVAADENLATLKAALEDASVALQEYMGESGKG
jgi:hypothetical protein